MHLIFAFICLAAADPKPPLPSNTELMPKGVDVNQWPEDFNPQTREQKVDVDTSTDEDVRIMEEDEDSENLPGNPENPSQ